MKNREYNIACFKKVEGLLACPVCTEPLHVLFDHAWVLVCEHRHTFNIAREGYVNLLTTHRRKASGYGQIELAARRRILQEGLFTPLVKQIAEIVRTETKGLSAGPLRVVDIGTGEGTVFSAILRELTSMFPDVEGCGADISVAGIRMASKIKHEVDVLWMVINALRRLPFQDHSAQVFLSILAPMSPEEAARIVKHAGVVVVVKPGEHHLWELREAIFQHERKSQVEKPLAEDISSPLVLSGTHRIRHTMPVSPELTDELIYMSPLFWKASRPRLEHLRSQGLNAITVDFEISSYRRK